MKVAYIGVGEETRLVDIEPDEEGSYLHGMQALVGGYIEPFDVLYGGRPCLYVNEDGRTEGAEPNRAVYATREMQDAGYLSQLDHGKVIEEGQFYAVLAGPILAVSYGEDGSPRDISMEEFEKLADDFDWQADGMEAYRAIVRGQANCEPPCKPGWEWKYGFDGESIRLDGHDIVQAEIDEESGYALIRCNRSPSTGMPIQTMPPEAYEALLRNVCDADRAGNTAPYAAYTYVEWGEKGEDARWAIGFEKEHGIEPSVQDYFDRMHEKEAKGGCDLDAERDDACGASGAMEGRGDAPAREDIIER